MPSYITSPQPTQLIAIYPGNTIALVNNAATDSGITTTQQVSIGPDPTGTSELTITNTTGQTAIMQTAPADVAAEYQPYSVSGGAVTVATDESLNVPCNARWVRFTFSVAPTTGSLFVTR